MNLIEKNKAIIDGQRGTDCKSAPAGGVGLLGAIRYNKLTICRIKNKFATSKMNTRYYIAILAFLILGVNANSQDLRIISTRELIPVTEKFGLDSALNLIVGMPTYYLDSIVTNKLIRAVGESKPTNKITYFLTDYSLNFDNPDLTEIIFKYYSSKKDLVKSEQPKEYGGFTNISNDELLTILKYSDNSTQDLLIELYYEWNSKSNDYYDDYQKGFEKNYPGKQERLQEPFRDCNLNCYKILIALDKLESSFPDSLKYKKHREYLKEYNKGTTLYKSGAFTDYTKMNVTDTIILTTPIKTLDELDYRKYDKLKKMFKVYNKSYCWKFLFHNENKGYLDLGCQSAPLAGYGTLLFLELKNNKLIIYEIQSWIS